MRKQGERHIDRLTMTYLLLMAVGTLINVGCDEPLAKRVLPAPLRNDMPYTIEGHVRRMWGADNFEFVSGPNIHYVVLRGVDTPKPGQDFFALSRNLSYRLMRGKTLQVTVFHRDEMNREVADVVAINPDPADIVGDQNVALELLHSGLAWFDGSEFETSNDYQQAERDAKVDRRGLWCVDDPVPPWEYEQQQQKKRENELREASRQAIAPGNEQR